MVKILLVILNLGIFITVLAIFEVRHYLLLKTDLPFVDASEIQRSMTREEF